MVAGGSVVGVSVGAGAFSLLAVSMTVISSSLMLKKISALLIMYPAGALISTHL